VGIGGRKLISQLVDGPLGLSDGSLQVLVASGGHFDMRGACKGKRVGGTT
jgi:hypothetical protein